MFFAFIFSFVLLGHSPLLASNESLTAQFDCIITNAQQKKLISGEVKPNFLHEQAPMIAQLKRKKAYPLTIFIATCLASSSYELRNLVYLIVDSYQVDQNKKPEESLLFQISGWHWGKQTTNPTEQAIYSASKQANQLQQTYNAKEIEKSMGPFMRDYIQHHCGLTSENPPQSPFAWLSQDEYVDLLNANDVKSFEVPRTISDELIRLSKTLQNQKSYNSKTQEDQNNPNNFNILWYRLIDIDALEAYTHSGTITNLNSPTILESINYFNVATNKEFLAKLSAWVAQANPQDVLNTWPYAYKYIEKALLFNPEAGKNFCQKLINGDWENGVMPDEVEAFLYKIMPLADYWHLDIGHNSNHPINQRRLASIAKQPFKAYGWYQKMPNGEFKKKTCHLIEQQTVRLTDVMDQQDNVHADAMKCKAFVRVSNEEIMWRKLSIEKLFAIYPKNTLIVDMGTQLYIQGKYDIFNLPRFVKKIWIKGLHVTTIGHNFLCGTEITHAGFSTPRLIDVGDCWLFKCTFLEQVDFRKLKRLEKVGHSWLSGCSSLKRVNFAGLINLQIVDDNWLHHCESLLKADFTGLNNLQATKNGWLSCCNFLKQVNFSGLNRLQKVGNYWLWKCDSLEEINFMEMVNLQTVGHDSLDRCHSLKKVALPPTWAKDYLIAKRLRKQGIEVIHGT